MALTQAPPPPSLYWKQQMLLQQNMLGIVGDSSCRKNSLQIKLLNDLQVPLQILEFWIFLSCHANTSDWTIHTRNNTNKISYLFYFLLHQPVHLKYQVKFSTTTYHWNILRSQRIRRIGNEILNWSKELMPPGRSKQLKHFWAWVIRFLQNNINFIYCVKKCANANTELSC